MFKWILLVLVLAAALGGGAYYNYQRNAHLDADLHKPRPYKTLATADIAKLIAAYEGEVRGAKQRVAGGPGEASQVDRYDASDVGGKAQGFAQYQRQNESWKRQRGHVMEQEHTLQELRFEKSIRDRKLDDERERIWRRLTTF